MVIINTNLLSYNSETKTFSGSEKEIPFDTTYTVKNEKTGIQKDFEFSHSTGPEFHPDTKWIYKNEELTLEICNDAKITQTRATNYLNAKMRN